MTRTVLETHAVGAANDATKMETSFDVGQHPSQMLRRDHRNDRYRERQAQYAEQAHDLERGRKERRIDKASGKIGHRFLLGVAAMFLALPPRAPCEGVHLPAGFSLPPRCRRSEMGAGSGEKRCGEWFGTRGPLAAKAHGEGNAPVASACVASAEAVEYCIPVMSHGARNPRPAGARAASAPDPAGAAVSP